MADRVVGVDVRLMIVNWPQDAHPVHKVGPRALPEPGCDSGGRIQAENSP